MTPQPRQGGSTPRAAELAAQQVEAIVAAAQESARQTAEAARKELEAARQEAEQVRVLAREAARAEVEASQAEARERIAEAQAAADDVLAETKAVSGGMRQLAHLLTTHAERIMRDVTNSHRAISAELRAAATREPERAGATSREEPSERPRDPAARGARSPGNPFSDLEPPSWVADPPARESD